MNDYVQETLEVVGLTDPEIAQVMEKELGRQKGNLELIASENIVSPAVMAAMGSVLTNKYAEGYPGKRMYRGCKYVDMVERIAVDRAKELFGAGFANVQPHSGSQANLAAYMALVQPGETVLAMNLAHGGHLTHGSPVNMSGILYNIVPYGVDDVTHRIDYDVLRKLAKEHKPKMILAGATAYSRVIDFEKFADIAKEAGAYLMVDMAHIAGLVAAGVHPSPVPYADVVTSTTHKTLRGPRGGLILCNNEELAAKVDKAVFPGMQGGPLMHVIAAKAVSFKEAMTDEFKTYQQNIVKNAAALGSAMQANGFTIVSGGTDNHLMLVDLRDKNITGKDFAANLDKVRITANKNTVPNDPKGAFVTSGIRLGTPAVTSRGMGTDEMKTIAHLIKLAATDYDNSADHIKEEVGKLCDRFPIY